MLRIATQQAIELRVDGNRTPRQARGALSKVEGQKDAKDAEVDDAD
jgi:hypothetical protein